MDFIEEFWPVAFFFALMGISYVRNAAKIKKEASQRPQVELTDEFPAIEPEETPEGSFEEKGGSLFDFLKQLGNNRQQEQQNVRKKSTHREVSSKKNSARPALPPEEEKRKEGRISMKNKSEAKKAFIYSEIFNRKY